MKYRRHFSQKRKNRRRRTTRKNRRGGGPKVIYDIFNATKGTVNSVAKGYAQNIFTGSTPVPVPKKYVPPNSWSQNKENIPNYPQNISGLKEI